jgi:sialic acid synthase SpsE
MESFYNHLRHIVSELQIDAKRIIIVGKGPSIREISQNAFRDSIIINVNDSELYVNGDITIFHASWITESLKKNGFKNKYYISNIDLSNVIPESSKWIKAEYTPLHNEGLEHIPEFFEKEEFFVSDFLLVSALKLAKILNNELPNKLPIYLIGFDFSYAIDSEIVDVSGHDVNYKQVLLRTQKEYYKYFVKYLRDAMSMNIFHVGGIDISDVSLTDFNTEFDLSKDLVSHKSHFSNIKAYQALIDKCENENYTIVVAELTNNHIGDKERLVKMIRAAKQSGADMIKVQKRDVDSFYTKKELESPYTSPFGSTLGDYRRGVELDSGLMEILINECNRLEICWFASILDYPSLEFIKQYEIPLIKLPSTISNHRNFLLKAGEYFEGDLVISTGFTDKSYEEFVLNNFTENRRLFLLQCTSSYPAPPEACQISVVRHYDELSSKKFTNILPGYSSHDLGSLGSMMAVSAGAKMVEKHVKLGNLSWIHFDGVALDLSTSEFDDYVQNIRKAAIMCGEKQKKIHKQEHHKYVPNETHN